MQKGYIAKGREARANMEIAILFCLKCFMSGGAPENKIDQNQYSWFALFSLIPGIFHLSRSLFCS